jgi:digeranylgeranylglycerophospholipid reductase
MGNASDAVVIGGGPCGSFAAYNLAKLGADVDVFEEHSEIGVPSHCAGHLSIKSLKDLGLYPLPEGIVENTFCGAIFHSPGDKKFSVRLPSPVTCVVDRVLFDKYIMEMAESAGARYHLSSHVDSLITEKGSARGITCQRGKTENYHAKLVIDAEGISSRILRQTGLPILNRQMLVNGVQAEVDNVEGIEVDMVEVFLGNDYAPGLYAWLIPKGDGMAKVGLATNSGNPKEYLQKLMSKHPVASKKLGRARILGMAFHPITLGGVISKPYSDGFLAVGDVASQVKSTTGGGVVLGMTSAQIAAEIAWKALSEKDHSSTFLSNYQKRFLKTTGFDITVMLRIRRFLNMLSDEKLDDAIDFCHKIGLGKAFQGIRDIDFQGRSLLHILPNPRMISAFCYLFCLYLSANP